MTTATFDTVAFPFMLGKEGGWDNDPRDRGNWTSGVIGKGELKGTKYGVASHVYPDLDIKNLTIAQAREIFWRDYAVKVAYDAMPPGIDVSVYDMGVNAGPVRSLALLRKALNSQVGVASGLAAVATASPDKVAVIKKFTAYRLSFYQGLATFVTYGRGWSRRAADCEVLSVKTWLTYGAQKQETEIKKTLEAEGKSASKAATGHATSGTLTTGSGGAGATQHEWAWHFDWITALEIGLAVTAVGLVLYFAWKAVAHSDRADAYANAAKATF